MPTTNILLSLIDVPADQVNNFNWPCAVSSGLPGSALSALARLLGLSDTSLLAALGLPTHQKKGILLDVVSSEAVFRVAQAYSELKLKTAWTPEVLSSWLTSENPHLRKRVPMHLLRSGIGYEYVIAAISRV